MSDIVVNNEIKKFELRNVKSVHGVVDIVCRIVENISKRLGKYEGVEKKELAKQIMKKVIHRLQEEGKISDAVAAVAMLAAEQDEVADVIDDVIDVWREHSKLVSSGCSFLRGLFKLCK